MPSGADSSTPIISTNHGGNDWPRTRRQRASVVTFGVVAGLDGITFAVALAALLFTGRSSADVQMALASTLVATAVIAIVIGLRSRESTNIGQVQDVSAAILATALARADVSVPTAFAVIGLTSLVTGVVLWLTGRFHVGRVVKYFPQPVLVGFLAGTGWLLLKGGVATAIGFSPGFAEIFDLGHDALRQVGLSAALALALFFGVRRFGHPAVMLAILAGALGAFYLWMLGSGTSMRGAIESGYLPGASSGASLQLPFPGMLDDVVWSDVASSAPTILTVAALCLFAMLMNTAALESATGRELDIDDELRTTGIANAAVAVVGGPPGYTGLSISAIGDKSGVRSRGAGVVAGVVVLLGFAFAKQIVSHVPMFVSAGFLMFLGLDLLVGWLVRTVRTYSVTEALTVVVILGFVVFSGFLQATIAGFVVACLLFAYSYARVPVVRSTATLASIGSTRERPAAATAYLRSIGTEVELVRLHGFLFFGSTERVVTHVRERIEDRSRGALRALVLDLTLVPGVDAASAAAFGRILQLAARNDVRMFIAGASPAVLKVLHRGGVTVVANEVADESLAGVIVAFDSIDPALQHVESWLLRSAPALGMPTLRERLAGDADPAVFDALIGSMRRSEHGGDEVILTAGEPGDELLIVEQGAVAVVRRNPAGEPLRLREMGDGAVVGDIGFSLGQQRTADIVALGPTTVLRISRAELDALEASAPAQFAMAHRIVSRALAEKVITANLMTDQVQR